MASRRLPQVLGWALVLTTVNLLISTLRSRSGVGAIASGILGAGWSLATFLAVPLIALEGLGPIAALRQPFALFKERWGEQIVGRAGVGAVFFLLGVVPGAILIGVGVALAHAAGVVVALIGVVIVAVALLLGEAATSVLAVALYRFATGSPDTGPFSPADLDAAVTTRGMGPRPAVAP